MFPAPRGNPGLATSSSAIKALFTSGFALPGVNVTVAANADLTDPAVTETEYVTQHRHLVLSRHRSSFAGRGPGNPQLNVDADGLWRSRLRSVSRRGSQSLYVLWRVTLTGLNLTVACSCSGGMSTSTSAICSDACSHFGQCSSASATYTINSPSFVVGTFFSLTPCTRNPDDHSGNPICPQISPDDLVSPPAPVRLPDVALTPVGTIAIGPLREYFRSGNQLTLRHHVLGTGTVSTTDTADLCAAFVAGLTDPSASIGNNVDEDFVSTFAGTMQIIQDGGLRRRAARAGRIHGGARRADMYSTLRRFSRAAAPGRSKGVSRNG